VGIGDGWICYGGVIHAQLNQTDLQNLSEVRWELVKNTHYFGVIYCMDWLLQNKMQVGKQVGAGAGSQI